MARPYDWAVGTVRALYDRRIAGAAVLNLDRDFPAGAEFLAAWRVIRDEAGKVANRLHEVPRFHEIMPEQA